MTDVTSGGVELTLSKEDKSALTGGGVVLRALGNVSKVSLIGGNSGAKTLVEQMQSLKPTYLAEVIRKMPYKGNENLPDKIVEILLGLNGSVRIPYITSKGEEKSIYKKASILSDTGPSSGERKVMVDILMPPVDTMLTEVTVQTFRPIDGREYVRFSATNEDAIRYRNIKVVGAKKTLSALLITNDGEEWTMYAICGANAIRIPFLERSIRISFLNRIKGFCDYVVSKLDN